jgi:serine/threonine protein kinase
MEYAAGGSLSEFLRRWEGGGGVSSGRGGHGVVGRGKGKGRGLTREWDGDLLRFMYEIARGMEYLHSKGVLHGDLKVRFGLFFGILLGCFANGFFGFCGVGSKCTGG